MALGLLSELFQGRCAPDQISMNAGISVCETVADWELALHLLMVMSAGRHTIDQYSFNAAIGACRKGGRWLMVLQLLGSMSQAKCTPDVISFYSAVETCSAMSLSHVPDVLCKLNSAAMSQIEWHLLPVQAGQVEYRSLTTSN